MVRLQKRISVGLEMLQYFTTRNWVFHNQSLYVLHNEMMPTDQKIFPTMAFDVDVMEYFKNIILGTRQYCMKEDLSTLPQARRHQKMWVAYLS